MSPTANPLLPAVTAPLRSLGYRINLLLGQLALATEAGDAAASFGKLPRYSRNEPCIAALLDSISAQLLSEGANSAFYLDSVLPRP